MVRAVVVVAGLVLAQQQPRECATKCNTQASECMKSCAQTTRELPKAERGAAMLTCVKGCETQNAQCKQTCSAPH